MSKLNKILKHLTDINFILKYLLTFKVSRIIPDRLYLKIMYRLYMGKKLDIKNPKTFNEKLQWLKIFDRNPEYIKMVDKFKVREYITKKLGEEYLIPLLGVWDRPEDIDFSSLPDKFVLKCNHNSGKGMCICKDKSKLDIKKVKKDLKKGLKEKYFYHGREWPYKNVEPKIIAEKFMTDSENEELKDYKIHMFNGEPLFILVCDGRFSKKGLTEDFYDTDWKHMDIKRPTIPNIEIYHEKPKMLDKMLELAKILAKDIPFVRIDFYVVEGKIYFGEITFFPATGMSKFEPEDWDVEFGKKLKLLQEKKV